MVRQAEAIDPPRRRRWPVVLGGVTAVLVVVAVVGTLIRLPYDAVGPGAAREVDELVTITGRPSFRPQGAILSTTVAVRERVSALEALVGWVDPDIDLLPQERVRGNIPPEEFRRLNVEAMADSKTTAEVLALRRLGFTDLGKGAEVSDVERESPAAAVLAPRDLIVGVDGAKITTSTDLVNAIKSRNPGDAVRLEVVRDGQARQAEATLSKGDDGRALLGVRVSTKIELPFKIEIDSGDVVGPSAGLAYALELVDVLTPGELTGGEDVAVTGALGAGGEVGAVGGVAQKAITARRAGASVFLVPKGNEREARAHAGDRLQVHAVSTFDEALKVLGSLQGSNALALAPVGP